MLTRLLTPIAVLLAAAHSAVATPNSYVAWNADPNNAQGYVISVACTLDWNKVTQLGCRRYEWTDEVFGRQGAEAVLSSAVNIMGREAPWLNEARIGSTAYYDIPGTPHFSVVAKVFFDPKKVDSWGKIKDAAQILANSLWMGDRLQWNLDPWFGSFAVKEGDGEGDHETGGPDDVLGGPYGIITSSKNDNVTDSYELDRKFDKVVAESESLAIRSRLDKRKKGKLCIWCATDIRTAILWDVHVGLSDYFETPLCNNGPK